MNVWIFFPANDFNCDLVEVSSISFSRTSSSNGIYGIQKKLVAVVVSFLFLIHDLANIETYQYLNVINQITNESQKQIKNLIFLGKNSLGKNPFLRSSR